MPYFEVQHNNETPVRLHYHDYGKGRPVVLLHGWPLSSDMWEYQLPALVNAGFRCIAYDRRGFGHSSRPWAPYDYDTLTADLHALMGHLQLEDVTLVGFSMGGGEVARYFGRYGAERIHSIVLLGAITPFMLKTADNPDGTEQAVFQEMLDKLAEDRMAFLDNFGKQFFGIGAMNHPVSTPLLHYYHQVASAASPAATTACVHAFSETDFRQDLPAIKVPALIIHGDADKIVPIDSSAEKTSAALPHARYIIYQGAPHGFFYTHRDLLNNDLLTFLLEG